MTRVVSESKFAVRFRQGGSLAPFDRHDSQFFDDKLS